MTDFVSKDEILDLIQNHFKSYANAFKKARDSFEVGKCCGAKKALIELEDALDDIESSDVAPVVHAKWEECDYVESCVHGFGTIRHHYAGLSCTHCANVFKKELIWKDNFCPNCGAKMDLQED